MGKPLCQCAPWYVGEDCACRNCTLGRGACVASLEHAGRLAAAGVVSGGGGLVEFGDCLCVRDVNASVPLWGREDCFCQFGCGNESVGSFGSHGKCSAIDGHCLCKTNWRGGACTEPYCLNDCSHHGTCITDPDTCMTMDAKTTPFDQRTACCECSHSFHEQREPQVQPATPTSCNVAARRLGWGWVKADSYHGLKPIGGVNGVLGFSLEPLVGFTLARGPTTSSTTDLPPGSQMLVLWGGKVQAPPSAVYGVRKRVSCEVDGCTGSRRRLSVSDRMWTWMPTDTTHDQFGSWRTGRMLSSTDRNPSARWLHASAHGSSCFFIHGGLGPTVDGYLLNFSVVVEAHLGMSADDIGTTLLHRLRTRYDLGRRVGDAGDPNVLSEDVVAEQQSWEHVEPWQLHEPGTAMASATELLGTRSISVNAALLRTHLANVSFAFTSRDALFDAWERTRKLMNTVLSDAENFTVVAIGAARPAVLSSASVFESADYAEPLRRNDLWKFTYSSNGTVAGGWTQLTPNRAAHTDQSLVPLTFGHKMAIVANESLVHSAAYSDKLYLFGGRTRSQQAGRPWEDIASASLTRVHETSSGWTWLDQSTADADTFIKHLLSWEKDVFTPWFDNTYSAWKQTIAHRLTLHSNAVRTRLLSAFNQTRLQPWKRLWEGDISGMHCRKTPKTLTDVCECVPGDYGDLKKWFTARIHQWAYIRDVEFALLRRSMAAQYKEFLNETGLAWREQICHSWGRITPFEVVESSEGCPEWGPNEEESMFSAAAPPAPVGSASGSDRSHPSLGPNVASAGLYSAFVEFERTTLYKLRRKLLGDFRAFILGLVEKLAAEDDKLVSGEFSQRSIEARSGPPPPPAAPP